MNTSSNKAKQRTKFRQPAVMGNDVPSIEDSSSLNRHNSSRALTLAGYGSLNLRKAAFRQLLFIGLALGADKGQLRR